MNAPDFGTQLVGKGTLQHEAGSCFVRTIGHRKEVRHCGDDRCLAAIPESWRPSKQKTPDTSEPGLHVWRDEQYGDLFIVHTFECATCEGVGGFGGQGIEYDVQCDDCDGKGVHEDEGCRCSHCKAIIKTEEARALLDEVIAESEADERSEKLRRLAEMFAPAQEGAAL